LALLRGAPRSHLAHLTCRKLTPLCVAWSQSAHVIVFPPFADYPDLNNVAKTDIKGYASTGNNVVFMGGFGTLQIMNEIFGWQLDPVTYQVRAHPGGRRVREDSRPRLFEPV